MKEFIEKLIGRLEEKITENTNDDMSYRIPYFGLCYAIEIVNQLAEEYKECDLCYFANPCEYQNKDAKLPLSEFEDDNGWIPCSERLPEDNSYIMLSFENFNVPVIGRYEEDENGGAFYAGDEDETLVSQYMFVNAWQPLPEPYQPKSE